MTITDIAPAESRSTRGVVPLFRPLLNGQEFEVQISEVSVSLGVGQHDVVKITASSTTLEDTDGMVDSLLSFFYGQTPRTEVFNGYITSVEEEQQAQGALSFTLTVMGPTKMMFEGTPRFLSNITVPSAVKNLVEHNLLGYTGHTHDYLWPTLVQTSETDWAAISAFAKRVGWSIFSRYGVVMCYNPLELFTNSGVYTRLVAGENADVSTDRVLTDFSPLEKSEVDQDTLGTKFGFFADQTPRVATQRGEFKGYIFEPRFLVRNQTEAEVYLSSVDLIMDGWKQHATATIWGDADIFPGMCVEIQTVNPRFMRDKYDGKWLVRASGQQLDRQQYKTQFYLCRPGSTAQVQNLPYRPFWSQQGRAKPNMTINEGRWISSWANPTTRTV